MRKEVFELLRNMDIRAVETQIVLRCAPFIAGLKTSNLLIIAKEQMADVRQLLEDAEFRCFILYQGDLKIVLLLYSACQLEDYLERKEVRRILLRQGYEDGSFQELLRTFAVRYEAYMQGKRRFPHEMGLFLGYPAEDVKGFIENKGQNALCAGYWKVYENAPKKMYLFQKFDQARDALIRLAAEGVSIMDMLKYV